MQSGRSGVDMERLFSSPDLFPWQFQGSKLLFLSMDRGSYQQSIFCDTRIAPLSKEILGIEVADLLRVAPNSSAKVAPLHFVFHMAHCGSTLLARALDRPESNLVCREPLTLRQLGAAAAGIGDNPPAAWRQGFALTVQLLARRYKPAAPVVVKANVPVNFMIGPLLQANPENRGVLLYLSLENYLLAVLKSPPHREWVKNIVNELGNGIDAVLDFSAAQRNALSAAEAAACLWAVQMSLFSAALAANDGLRSLNAEMLYTQPSAVLAECFALFGQSVDGEAIAEIVESQLFSRYSKDPSRPYDNAQRLADRDASRQSLSGELRQGTEWLEKRREKNAIPHLLDRPLGEPAGASAG